MKIKLADLSFIGSFIAALLAPIVTALGAATPTRDDTGATWSSLNGVNFALASGEAVDCGDGSLQYVSERGQENVRFGARIQFAFNRDEKQTEKNETGPDSGCKQTRTTTATPMHLHRVIDVHRCLNGIASYGISEDFAVTGDDLAYTYERRSAGKTTKKFRCLFKRKAEKMAEKTERRANPKANGERK